MEETPPKKKTLSEQHDKRLRRTEVRVNNKSSYCVIRQRRRITFTFRAPLRQTRPVADSFCAHPIHGSLTVPWCSYVQVSLISNRKIHNCCVTSISDYLGHEVGGRSIRCIFFRRRASLRRLFQCADALKDPADFALTLRETFIIIRLYSNGDNTPL